MTAPSVTNIGVNVTSAESLAIARRLHDAGEIDFCELLIDNFLHLPGRELFKGCDGMPVAIHIMNSRFLDADDSERKLADLARRIKEVTSLLNPKYVSDHLALFSVNGRRLPIVSEVNYADMFDYVIDRLHFWQECLGSRLLLENFGSVISSKGSNQPSFFQKLIEATGCGLLFDFSNAVVAERNTGLAATEWILLGDEVRHGHIGGFRESDSTPPYTIDSHDANVDGSSLKFLSELNGKSARPIDSIVVERDANLDYESWLSDIRAVRRVVC